MIAPSVFFAVTRLGNANAPVVDCNFAAIAPLTEYPRSTGQSVTGGYVYRGSAIPDLIGVYVYADFLSHNLFQYFDSGSGVIESVTATSLFIAAFGEAHSGELYLVDLVSGKLHKLIAN
jgi:hypothetical protein